MKKPKPPHPTKPNGNADQLLYRIGHPALAAIATPDKLDKMRVGRIENGRRYLGGNCHEVVNQPPAP